MKKNILSVVAILCLLCVHATEISSRAWKRLREIHAIYTEDVEGRKWDAVNADTDAFLENNIGSYVLGKKEEREKFLIYHWIVIACFGIMLMMTFFVTKADSR